MPNLNIYLSNRLEILVEQLAEIIRTPLSSPLIPEIILIQSRGMERWISLELANHIGIWANFHFPFPNVFLQEIFKRFISDLPEPSPWDPEILTFTIMNVLPDCIDQSGFENIKTYLNEDPNHLKLFQLSEKIALTFDQYMVFRPELLFDWEAHDETDDPDHIWQATLWRRLIKINGPKHRARLHHDLHEMLGGGSIETAGLPERISVFGISYLPPFHLETFTAISRYTPVNFFLLNPCREYWTDIVSRKTQQRIRRNYPDAEELSEQLHFEEGNRLLASMGRLGKDFFQLLNDLGGEFHEMFDEPSCHDMLSCIQSDILTLRNRGRAERSHPSGAVFESLPAEPLPLTEDDASIQIHNCHSPMREIEVLHDCLLAMFEEDPALLPKDIIVMAPDIDSYAPYIHAVFDAQTISGHRIPFSIADQSARKESRLIDGFFSLLALKDSRLGGTQVLRLLEYPSIKKNFAFSDSDIPVIERWMRHTRIRWGRDVQDRLKFGLPRFSENTWRSGIERLLLGYAMPGYQREMFGGILPYDDVEGEDVYVLGKFVEFSERIFRCVNILEQSKTLNSWKNALHFILEQIFATQEEDEREIQTLRMFFDQLADRQKQSGFNQKVDLEIIRTYLANCLSSKSFRSGFMSRGVTFCAMLPMRSIPFKIICLLGLNTDTFPRDDQSLSFDLIARNSKIGDRSRRNDDKYLFLESIISARKKLYISYIGQSIQDNSRIPPSVLVSELLDTIAESFYPAGKNIHEQVMIDHNLQAFSEFYFQGDSKRFSYSLEDMLASTQRQSKMESAPLFITQKLDLTADERQDWKSIDVETLCLFFSNPARFLLERRLGIFLDAQAATPEDRETLELTALDEFDIAQNLFRSRQSGMDLAEFRPIQQALGQLPPAHVGDALYNEMSLDADSFFNRIETYVQTKFSDPLDVDDEISGFRLSGRLADIYDHGNIHLRYANRRASDLLRLWIHHLIYCRLKPENLPSDSLLINKNGAIKISYTSKSREILESLLQLFHKGLSQPLHFFPETSLEYIHQMQKKPDNPQRALDFASKKWMGSEYHRGESADAYYQLCFKNSDPMDRSFEEIAKCIYLPILAQCKEIIL
jgi:exodeoxyribonuclease V gamma subunit